MLHAGHDRVAIRRAFALHGFHHAAAHLRAEEGVFTKAFRAASPTRFAGHINHRRPRHVEAVIRGFISRDASHLSDGIQIPACRQAKWNRENGALTVHHVIGEEQRNFQAAELHHLILHGANILTRHGVKNCPDLTVLNHVANRRFWRIRSYADQTHLPDFFIKGHFAEQLIHKGVARLFSHRMWAKQIVRESGLHG